MSWLPRLLVEQNIDELFETGKAKIKDATGAVAVAAPAGGAAAPAAAAAAAPEAKKEEEEIDLGGGMDMFGGEAGAGGDY